jgi:hypothetical protein
VNGLDRRRLAAVNAITGEVSGWSPKPDGRVEVIAVSGGRIYVGGRFRRIAGRQRRGLAAFDARTGRLLDWNPALDGTVTTLAISGRMVYVGYFPSARDSHGWRVAPIDGVSGNAGGWKRVLSGAVEAIAVSGPVVYVGGWGERLVALAARTGRRTTWKPNPDGDVDAIAVSGPKVAVGGGFGSVGPAAERHGLAAFDTASGELTAWRADLADNAEIGAIAAIAVGDSAVYVGGSFSRIAGQSRQGLVALDPVSGAVQRWDPSPNGAVKAISPGSVIYVGGDFNRVGGEQRRNLAAVDAASGRATAWNPRPDGRIGAIVQSGPVVYVGGDFSHMAGVERHGIAAVDAASGQPTGWDPDADGQIRAITVVGSTVYVAGDFSHIGGEARRSLAALDATTGKATPWNPGLLNASQPDATWVEMLVVADSTVIIGDGNYDLIGGVPRRDIAAIDAVTGKVTTWEPELRGGIVASLLVLGSTLYVGGYFSPHLAAFPLTEITRG